ncbi:patatin-like phospholipase family protein [Sphaerotilus microaerophilus]|uniref:NTE family protein YlbK n=1 Tax=Sphaerotilus microaerophilus TaxID=2914710 RepID=A0ABN6PMI7_9BURK|nr:patatin-like phospholipase family protein [Sphaerotilus sp. FB-5]BDI06384.1 putative NTE family protein YlbK [Sphaerotilus sp. FB-5]
MERPKIAMVLGAGGLRCVSAFGALAVLRREGIDVDMVVACSGGAAVGYWIAAGGTDIPEGIARYTEGMAHSFGSLGVRRVLRALLPRWLGYSPRGGLMKDQRFNRYMAAELRGVRFEDLQVPLHFVAADVHSGEQVVLSSGPVFDAMRATLAIPLLLPPWEVDGRLLVDGGICNPLPVDVAMREGADIILAMGFEDPLQSELDSSVALIRQVLAVSSNHLMRAQFAFHSMAHHAEVIPVIPDFGQPVGLRDLHLIPHLVRQGELATERELPYLRRLLQAQLVQPAEATA